MNIANIIPMAVWRAMAEDANPDTFTVDAVEKWAEMLADGQAVPELPPAAQTLLAVKNAKCPNTINPMDDIPEVAKALESRRPFIPNLPWQES